jgi:protein tyrosine phosphatase type 4A
MMCMFRATAPTYDKSKLIHAGINVHEMSFPDGDVPPPDIVARWLQLCKAVFGATNPDTKSIAIHCIAGLGRTPVLVAIALIESGVNPLDAVHMIRGKRRGAINAKQLDWLENIYKPKTGAATCCVIT